MIDSSICISLTDWSGFVYYRDEMSIQLFVGFISIAIFSPSIYTIFDMLANDEAELIKEDESS